MTATDRKPQTQPVANLPLPAGVWKEITDAMSKGKSGQITLHLKEGRITDLVDIYLRVRTGKDGC